MSKDPAFLFYSKDFYEGTRMMMPEERACYIDLLIYQHQNGGIIPNDIKRLALYCSGVSEATLQATLEAKFKLSLSGWYNEKLKSTMNERENFSKRQSINGVIGQFWKKTNKILTKNEVKKLKSLSAKICSDNNEFKENWIDKIKDPKAMLEAMLKHLAIEDVIEIKYKKESEIIFPFETEKFKSHWKIWKDFKKEEHNFNYKSEVSEQAALKNLSELSKCNEEAAIKIINQSIQNGWKGLFKIDENERDTKNTAEKTNTAVDDLYSSEKTA